MKRNFLLFVFLCTTVVLFATNVKLEVPANVLKAFKSKYPNASDAEWMTTDESYLVEFEDEDGFYKNAFFDLRGNWMKTEYEINDVDVPAAVMKVIEETYAEFEYFNSSIKVEEPSKKYLIMNFEHGESFVSLVIDENGKILEKSEESLDEDDRN